MKSFAIVLVCYNRLPGVKRLIKSLENADYNGKNDITLIFSIDNSGNKTVEDFANEYKWKHGEKIIRTFPQRQGLKNHILQCGDFTEKYDIVAVFEDDIYASESFYNYAYQAAEYYWGDDNIAGISLYGYEKHWLNWAYRFEPMKSEYDNYFLKVAQSWGQVWTGPKWKKFKEWYNKNIEFKYSDKIPLKLNDWVASSWLKYHMRYCIEENKYYVYPYVGLSTNFSDAGEHSNSTTPMYQCNLQTSKKQYSFAPFNSNSIIYDEYMERESLGKALSVPDAELTVDLYSTRNKGSNKRYLLSAEKYDYKVISSYAYALRPIEANALNNIPGSMIKLYDTTQYAKNTDKYDLQYYRMVYNLRYSEPIPVMKYALKAFIHNLNRLKNIPKRIKRKLKR